MKRLKRIAKQMYSKPTLELSGFLTPSGLYYTFSVRLLNKKPMYSINCRDVFDSWKQRIESKINDLVEQEQDLTIKMKPLFLGDSEYANC